MYSIEDFDKAKTRILKYIMYKKRTESEIKTKFSKDYDEVILEDVIEYLKEANYINDEEYIKTAIDNFKILKNFSNMELKYKLIAKGLNKNLIEDYFYENQEELKQYEIKSATNVIEKKKRDLEEFEIKNYLLKKGYKQENISEAFDNINN